MINAKNLENEKILKCGYIGVIGRPNVGKSSLINNILKKSVTITSKKRQTTRDCILGVLTQDNSQFIFVDTPGIESSGKHERNRILNSLATATLNDVDLILWVVEAKEKLASQLLIANILDSKELIENNYDIMQLSSPMLSIQAKRGIDETFEHYKPHYNQTEMRKMMIRDGVLTVATTDLEQRFNNIITSFSQ